MEKITMGLPRGRKFADDRAPTIEEIHRLTDFPDRRTKAVMHTMCSSGIRLGAWDYLRWAYYEIQKWISYRENTGENILPIPLFIFSYMLFDSYSQSHLH